MNSPSGNYQPIAPGPPPSNSTPIQPYQPIASTSSAVTSASPQSTQSTPAAAKPAKSSGRPPPKKKRRSKVESACRFCRKSHMACDGLRPCSRCIKREIPHLCTDEPSQASAPPTPPSLPPPAAQLVPETSANSTPAPLHLQPHQQNSSNEQAIDSNSMLNTLGLDIGAALRGGSGGGTNGGAGGSGSNLLGYQGSMFNSNLDQHSPSYGDFNMALLDLANDGLGAGLGLDMTTTGDSEFQGLGLSEFLASLSDAPYMANDDSPATVASMPAPSTSTSHQIGGLPINDTSNSTLNPSTTNDTAGSASGASGSKDKGKEREKMTTTSTGNSTGHSVPGSPINKTERFLLTAADQKDGSRSDRLARVIHAKFEAGLLRPYNHVAGYTRLMKWMADNMSASSRQRTLHTLSEFRPTFRAIASGLTDLDLVFIEEAFERLLLDYDRVFSSMGIPSCLWRRTGEIYKGNKEFAALVGVPIENLQGGKMAIYELMAEESAVNYWEKYGNIAFDVGQKAVLTSCVLINQSILSRSQKRKRNQQTTEATIAGGGAKKKAPEEAMVSAAFSFTIRRDSYGIPSMIVGNFLKL
ncbi:Zn(II)2Cys6 transcription factor domain-containing protein [Sporobolomyces salmoneus]|uniref:Zn(II)2Cys6 transcription factor domain-containing protein n=1 Tax=Sporobolomyces salmoneus TaxID=183962 RepID=UPI003171D5B8